MSRPVQVRNISTVDQLGLAPGEVGTRDLTEEEEQRYVARGAIEVASASNETEASSSDNTEED